MLLAMVVAVGPSDSSSGSSSDPPLPLLWHKIRVTALTWLRPNSERMVIALKAVLTCVGAPADSQAL